MIDRLRKSALFVRLAIFGLVALIAVMFGYRASFAQSVVEQAERSYFIGYVEDQLSTPNRQIRIGNIQGALSSNATIGSITIADREGIWLRISNARIVWTRTALLSGRLDIDTLAADQIDVLRKPLPEEGMPAPEANGFQLPELPLSIDLDKLEVPRVTFGEGLFGLESAIAVDGRLQLADGSLDTGLNIRRLDGPGGQLALTATYANTTRQLDLDLTLNEPADGMVANLLSVEGRPPMALALKGFGPLDALNLALTLDADQQRVLTGTTILRRQADGLGFDAKLEGPISRLVAPQFRNFFGANTSLTATGATKDAGGFELESLNLVSNALTLNATAATSTDGFLSQLALDAVIADANAQKTVLPIAGGETRVGRAELKLSFGERGEQWNGNLDIAGLATSEFGADVAVTFGGLAQNLSRPAERRITFAADSAVLNIVADRAEIAEALGERITLDVDGEWSAGQPVKLANARVQGNGLSANLAGEIAENVFDGTIALDAGSIAPFSTVAARELAGVLDLDARGTLTPLAGGFDLTFDGTGNSLAIGEASVDPLLAGQMRLTGRAARGENGLIADGLRIFNEQMEMKADGRIASGEADFDFDLSLADLALVSERAGGKLTAKGRAAGTNGAIRLSFDAAVPQGMAVGKTLTEGRLGFLGMLRGGETLDGAVTGNAFLDGVRATLSSKVAASDEVRGLSDLDFQAGGTRITGEAVQDKLGLIEGRLMLQSADISTAAALLLAEASGAVNAEIKLTKGEGRQDATVTGNISNLTVEDVRIGRADIEARAEDLFNVPIVDGSVRANDLSAAGIEVATLSANATRQQTTTNFDATAALKNGADISTKGALSPEDGGYRLKLDALDLRQGDLAARLTEPSTLLVRGANVTLDGVVLDVGGGRVEARGEIADTLDLDVVVRALPLAIANAVKPDLALGGTLDGTAKVGGTRVRPEVNFEVEGRSLSASALRGAGLSTLSVDAKGTSTNDRLNVNASVTSPEGLRATAQGGIPLDGGQLGLDVNLNAFPLATLNAVAPGQDLAGSISGTARVTGTLEKPAANFDLRGEGIGAAPLNAAGLSPLRLTARGAFSENTMTLAAADFSGPQGFTLTANGRVPVSGGDVNVSLNGQAPLGLANRFLADRGAQASGTVTLQATVSGNIRRPVVRGMFSTVGAQVIDPETNVRLRDIAVMGTLEGDRIVLRNATAALGAGGAISASGSVSTAAGFSADLRINLNQARYADGNLVVATVNGALTLTGPLARDPLLAGRIEVVRAEITVPDSIGASGAMLDVKHIRPPADVAATLKRAKANDGTPTPSGRPSVVRLNVTVDAPSRVFVRGRGLDAELGGSMTLTGPATNIQPVGGFRLIRGRLGILGQRITFDEGEVTLVGDLDPYLDFIARSGGGDITVFITVRGRVSDLDISFSSQPQLPEDEVLARLIFNRGINELSPLQIAQLAAAAAELAGGGNTSLLGSLRDATGLDDLDVVTDSEGNAAVRAGRYIQENIYLGVEAGAKGTARGTVNLDITEELKAKGSVGSDGDSSVGIFYEKDY